MTDNEPTTGALDQLAPSLFKQVLAQLVAHHHQTILLHQLAPDVAVVYMNDGKRNGVIVAYQPEAGEEQFRLITGFMKAYSTVPLDVAVVGGPRTVMASLKKCRPSFTRRRVSLFHLSDELAASKYDAPRKASAVSQTVVDFADAPALTPEDWERLHSKMGEDLPMVTLRQHEADEFAAGAGARRPIATYILCGVILLVFFLQHRWGGTENGILMIQMGALLPGKVMDGEVWRLFTCTFLHAGFSHLIFNLVVLYILGNSLERILGTNRFLVLYGASALGGSLASLVRLGDDGFGVGASGALWGLLGAEAVLVFYPRGLLPQASIARGKRVALTNLGLNVLNSLHPQVDWAAHFGGGVVGAGLIALGAFVAGLPKLGESGSTDTPKVITPPWLRLSAAASAVLLGAGLLLGLGTGKAWQLNQPPTLSERTIAPLGIAVALPEGFKAGPVTGAAGEAQSVMFGDAMSAPALVEILKAKAAEPFSDEQLELEISTLLERFTPEIPGQRPPLVIQPVERTDINGRPALIGRFSLQNGAVLERGFLFLSDSIVRVELAVRPGFLGTHTRLIEPIMKSVRALE